MQVHLRVDAVPGVKGVVVFPAALEDILVDARVLGVLPALDAAAVDVRAEAELGVARLADAEAVGIGYGVGWGEEGGRGGGVPEGAEKTLGREHIGVGAGVDLGGGPVEFVDGGVVGGKGFDKRPVGGDVGLGGGFEGDGE